MFSKINKFFKKPFKIKLLIIKQRLILAYKSICFFCLRPLVTHLMKTRVGRDVFFSSLSKNELIIGSTDEGLRYVINSSDNIIGRTVFREKKSYDKELISAAVKIIKNKRKILVDVGANVGTIGIFALAENWFEQCIAIEPEPHNFQLLSANVLLNQLSERFFLRNEALSSDAEGLLDFELSEVNFGDHRVRITSKPGLQGEENRKVISVKVNTLDAVLANFDTNECVIFMDTQGFEGNILGGAKGAIEAGVPIVTEFWPYGLLRADGLERFYSALLNAPYTAMYDLKHPEIRLRFSIDAVRNIANDLGVTGKSTDLVFVCE